MTREEFGQYVCTEYPKLLRFVKSRVSNPHDAEEIIQNTLVRLLLICDDIDTRAPAGFFFTALRNAIIDHWRKRGHQPPPKELPEYVPGPPAPPVVQDPDERAQCREAIRQAAARLTPRERQALAAYWQAWGDRAEALAGLGLSDADNAERYKVYDGALHHAKRKLAAGLEPARARLQEAGAALVWELVNEELCGSAP